VDTLEFKHFLAWHKSQYRRGILENYAKENNFDPLNAAMWHQQVKTKVMATKVFSVFDF
jgi:hypothetical protein